MPSQRSPKTDASSLAGAPAESAEWIIRLQEQLGWRDRDKVYTALLATLHGLRDHLSTDEIASLGARLPTLLRGLYYEGWHPREHPMRLEDRQAFLSRIHEVLHRELGIDPDRVVRDVFKLLSERISAPELEEIKAACPPPLHGLWPD